MGKNIRKLLGNATSRWRIYQYREQNPRGKDDKWIFQYYKKNVHMDKKMIGLNTIVFRSEKAAAAKLLKDVNSLYEIVVPKYNKINGKPLKEVAYKNLLGHFRTAIRKGLPEDLSLLKCAELRECKMAYLQSEKLEDEIVKQAEIYSDYESCIYFDNGVFLYNENIDQIIESNSMDYIEGNEQIAYYEASSALCEVLKEINKHVPLAMMHKHYLVQGSNNSVMLSPSNGKFVPNIQMIRSRYR